MSQKYVFSSDEDPSVVLHRLNALLVCRGVDTAKMSWLSFDEGISMVEYWTSIGVRRYGRLSLQPPVGSNIKRGEFADGDVPSWLDVQSRPVFVKFSRPTKKPFIARCDLAFAVANCVVLARSDGDGFAAMTPDLEGVLLVNVEDRLGDSILDFDAWGVFVKERDSTDKN